MSQPWKKWIPGVLNTEQIEDLCKEGLITGVASPDNAIGESAIDLTLSDECYEMTQGSVKPLSSRYKWFITEKNLAVRLEPAGGSFELAPRKTYLFKLRERLERELSDGRVHGMATAKSSVGRVDVLARLIVDGMNRYEYFDPDGRGTGDMYLEITPMTFSVKVKEGISLSQLRLFYGKPEECELKDSRELCSTVLHGSDIRDGSLSVDLTDKHIGGLPVAAFCAGGEERPDPVPLWKQNEPEKPRPEKYWRFVRPSGEEKRITIEKTRFYILRSKERISLPQGIAVYCRASDETIGEMRIHYAGFAHPWFGWDRPDGEPGTPLMFEVRGHDVNVSLADGEKMAGLSFYRMSQDCSKPKHVAYNLQNLQLSNFFGEWSDKLRLLEDGKVEPLQER